MNIAHEIMFTDSALRKNNGRRLNASSSTAYNNDDKRRPRELTSRQTLISPIARFSWIQLTHTYIAFSPLSLLHWHTTLTVPFGCAMWSLEQSHPTNLTSLNERRQAQYFIYCRGSFALFSLYSLVCGVGWVGLEVGGG